MIKFLTLLILLTSAFAMAAKDRGYTSSGFAVTAFWLIEDIKEVTTTDATQTTLISWTLPTDGDTWLVTTTCHADGDNIETFEKSISVSRASGLASINGSIVNNFTQPSPSYAFTYDTNSADLRARITGATSDTVVWHCIYGKKTLK